MWGGMTSAWALDVDPYTYFQSPKGTSSLLVQNTLSESTNLKYSSSNQPYVKGGNADNSRVVTDAALIHYTGFYEIQNVMVDPHLVVPYGSVNQVKMSGYAQEDAAGFGDPLLAVVLAPVHTADNSRFLGLGVGTYVPLGRYNPQKTINIGENRWKQVVQLTGIQQIIPQWAASLTVDSTFYNDNGQAGTGGTHRLTQENSYQVQPWLRYRPIQALAVSVGYSQTFGGKQKLDGVENGFETNQRQIRLDVAAALAQNLFLGVQLDRDIAVEGGFRESFRAITRLTVQF